MDSDDLIGAWLHARCVARGLPAPVAEQGGWRVDTQQPHELRRHVFAGPCDGLRELALAIDMPRVFLKMCGSEDEMRPLLPARWQFEERRRLMTGEDFAVRSAPLAAGYSVQMYRNGATISARIVARNGELAASGYAAEVGGVFIYDQINTSEAHRRRGLGSHLMQVLRSARRSASSIHVLVATEAGRALYLSLGWRVRSAYVTAHIPASAPGVFQLGAGH